MEVNPEARRAQIELGCREFERHFLARYVDAGLAGADYLDSLDLLAVTHPDAPDLRLESFTRMLLATEERHRALEDALDTARVMALAGKGSAEGEPRFVAARRACEAFAPESPWLALSCTVAPPTIRRRATPGGLRSAQPSIRGPPYARASST